MTRVVIVGGGISGLAAAYRLRTLAPEVQVTLIEREARLGGKILTERAGGFVIEAGADCFLSRKPRGIALCEELGVTERLQGRDPAHARTFVRSGGALHPLPEGLTGMVPTNLEALAQSTLISPEGQARLAEETELPPAPGDEDESVAGFVTRRVGREVFERLVEPLMGGIYAGDAAQLSLASTFPQLRQLEHKHGSLLRGLVAAQAQSDDANASGYPPFISFRSGMEELVELLLTELDEVKILTGHTVGQLGTTESGYQVTLTDGSRHEADALILTTPAFVTARLVAPLDEALAAAHQAIPYASVATLSVAYRDPSVAARFDGYGYVIPTMEGTEVLACTWSSNKWAGRAPDGAALIRVYLGRYGGRNVLAESDDTLLAMALEEIERTLDISEPPDQHWLYRWPEAMPQYTLGHPERLALIEQRLAAHPGLFVAGAAYRGVGIPDCILSGEQAARAALAHVEPNFVTKERSL
ncbi:MAG: protoporphyrinogen oxidase [Ardenticatenales bacterium]|nr:protoporphyrinogen oxidase [Ardenticatenales bacterium]